MDRTLDRRKFLQTLAAGAATGAVAGMMLGGCTRPEERGIHLEDPKRARRLVAKRVGSFREGVINADADVAIASRPDSESLNGDEVQGLVRSAIGALGGMSGFVHPGDKVVIKPNLAFARNPGTGANTNPDVLAATIRLCKEAGAKEVVVVEHGIDQSVLSFLLSGASDVAESLGVPLIAAENENMYEEVVVGGELIARQLVIKEILACDCYVNLPVAKQHNAVDVCVGMKNQLGAVWRPQDFHESASLRFAIAELARVLKPTLTIVDAIDVMLNNGPKGPGD
ncbi:MAG: DUF362 domain-containing protein, partial [Armatimonadota bacterium]